MNGRKPEPSWLRPEYALDRLVAQLDSEWLSKYFGYLTSDEEAEKYSACHPAELGVSKSGLGTSVAAPVYSARMTPLEVRRYETMLA